MYNRKKIIPGLIMFLGVATFPFSYGALFGKMDSAAHRGDLEKGVGVVREKSLEEVKARITTTFPIRGNPARGISSITHKEHAIGKNAYRYKPGSPRSRQ